MSGAMFKHEPHRRFIECVCGWSGPAQAFEAHCREAIRETAREVMRRHFEDLGRPFSAPTKEARP